MARFRCCCGKTFIYTHTFWHHRGTASSHISIGKEGRTHLLRTAAQKKQELDKRVTAMTPEERIAYNAKVATDEEWLRGEGGTPYEMLSVTGGVQAVAGVWPGGPSNSDRKKKNGKTLTSAPSASSLTAAVTLTATMTTPTTRNPPSESKTQRLQKEKAAKKAARQARHQEMLHQHREAKAAKEAQKTQQAQAQAQAQRTPAAISSSSSSKTDSPDTLSSANSKQLVAPSMPKKSKDKAKAKVDSPDPINNKNFEPNGHPVTYSQDTKNTSVPFEPDPSTLKKSILPQQKNDAQKPTAPLAQSNLADTTTTTAASNYYNYYSREDKYADCGFCGFEPYTHDRYTMYDDYPEAGWATVDDVGMNWALCDKDCGWCGRCEDNYTGDY